MTATLTTVGDKVLLRIDGSFVAAYDSAEQAEQVLEAYRGHVA